EIAGLGQLEVVEREEQRGQDGQDRESEEAGDPRGGGDPAPALLLSEQGGGAGLRRGRRPARPTRCAHPSLPSARWGRGGPQRRARSSTALAEPQSASSNSTCRSASSFSVSASTSTPGWLSSSDLNVSRRSLARLWLGIGSSWLGTSA